MASRQRERRRCLEVLGVQEDATDDDIRKAYRRMALIFHPDKNKNEDANEKFQEISYAYKYLSEGPSAVGFEEDGHFSGHAAGGHDIPIEVLIRLFPWMMGDFGVSRPSPFGGLFGQHFHPSPFQHFFMDPFSGMRGFDDGFYDDDDDDEEEIVYIENGRITVIKTGNSNGKRRNKYGQRRRNNDPFQSSSSPFHVRPNQHSQHSSHSHSHHFHVPKYNNVHSQNRHSSGCFNSPTSNDSYTTRPGSNNKNTASHSQNKTAYTSSATNDKPFSHETATNTQTSSAQTNNKTSYTDSLYDVTKDGNKSATKNKPSTVITSRKERKKMKKASKAASQEKSSVNQGNTTEAKQEEMYEPVDTVSEDESSNFDDLEDFGSTQIPLKLNKKQRRKLKRERERLEKEMDQSSRGSNRTPPDGYSFTQEGSTISEEVRDDDEMSTTSSTTYDTDFSHADSKSRRARKTEKKKQKQDFDSTQNPLPSTQYDNLFPRSEKDEEEMIRIAMEMSKLEMNPDKIEEQGTSHAKSKNERHSNDEGHISPIQGQNNGSNSWYNDIGTSPFYKSPMEDMKKTYYKDMSASHFDPGSYYRPSQSADFSHQSNKDNFARSSNNHRKSSESKPHGHETRYFYSNNYSHGAKVDGASYKSPVERHEQKYFRTAPRKQNVKQSFDLDELDDVPLDLNTSNSRGVQNGSFNMGEVLNGSLNVPKGIHVKHANNIYDRK